MVLFGSALPITLFVETLELSGVTGAVVSITTLPTPSEEILPAVSVAVTLTG